MNEHHVEDVSKMLFDGLSLVVVVGTLASILPPIAALLTIVWTVIRIFETETVRGWLGRKSQPRQGDE